jgi:hypothetical protein
MSIDIQIFFFKSSRDTLNLDLKLNVKWKLTNIHTDPLIILWLAKESTTVLYFMQKHFWDPQFSKYLHATIQIWLWPLGQWRLGKTHASWMENPI